MKRYKRLHYSKYVREQRPNFLRRVDESQRIPSDDEEEKRKTHGPQRETDRAPLSDNIFDFLTSDFAQIQSNLVLFYALIFIFFLLCIH